MDKQKGKIAAEIPAKYDYMDSLPMEGWAWEFVRRNKKYIEAFNELEKTVKAGAWNDECNKRLSELRKVALPNGLVICRVSSVWEADKENLLILKLPPYEGERAVFNKYFGSGNHLGIIPRPEARYCDFTAGMMFRPQIPDYGIFESLDLLLNQQKTLKFSPESNIPIVTPSANLNEDVFYIAISKRANIAYLKEHMLADVANILEKDKPRVRQRKWRYYLIVFDLKQKFNDKMSYDDIAAILIQAYPDEKSEYFADTRNINHWYEYATSLIDGGFKKYLKH